MLERTRIVSRDLDAARRFYAATARPLGLTIIEAQEDGFALGRLNDAPVLRVKRVSDQSAGDATGAEPSQVAIEAPDDYTVRAFYRAALEAGGRQLVYPAPQPTSAGSYYAARVEDPDGNCIECGWRH